MKQILFLAFALSLSINSSAEVFRRTTTVTDETLHRTTVTQQEEVLGYSGRGDRPISSVTFGEALRGVGNCKLFESRPDDGWAYIIRIKGVPLSDYRWSDDGSRYNNGSHDRNRAILLFNSFLSEGRCQDDALGYSGRSDRRTPECHMELINLDGKQHAALYVGDMRASIDRTAGYRGYDSYKVLKGLVDRGDCKVYQKCEVIDMDGAGQWGITLGGAVADFSYWSVMGPTKSLNEMRLKGYCQ